MGKDYERMAEYKMHNEKMNESTNESLKVCIMNRKWESDKIYRKNE
jgi:hypothetical protein